MVFSFLFFSFLCLFVCLLFTANSLKSRLVCLRRKRNKRNHSGKSRKTKQSNLPTRTRPTQCSDILDLRAHARSQKRELWGREWVQPMQREGQRMSARHNCLILLLIGWKRGTALISPPNTKTAEIPPDTWLKQHDLSIVTTHFTRYQRYFVKWSRHF